MMKDFQILNSEKKNLLLFLLCLINGFFYVFFIPPWQKPDEPGHFEYAWLIANHETLPKSGDFDWELRRELVSSMIENNFYNKNISPPELLSLSNPPSIVTPQINDRPLYYILVSLPLIVAKGSDLELQLYLARLVSWIFFLGTVLISQKLIAEILGSTHVISFILPLSLSLLPGFADIMTAVNDDVGATFFFSLFLFICVLILKNGATKNLLFFGVMTTILCFYTKDTTIISIPLFILTFTISKVSTFKTWKAIYFGIVILSISSLFLFRWGDAKNWLRTSTTIQKIPTSVYYKNAPHGKYVLELVASKDKPLPTVIQYSRTESSNDFSEFTIGSYIWSTEEDLSIIPFKIIIDNGIVNFTPSIQVTNDKTFYHFTFQAPKHKTLKIELNPLNYEPENHVSIFYDGIVLVEGKFPQNSTPNFVKNGEELMWDNKYLLNLIENPSFESRIPYFNPYLSFEIWNITRYIYSPNLIISSLFDLKNSGWYFISTLRQLNSTFWAKFGWGHVTLKNSLLPRPYFTMGIFSISGMAGFLLSIFSFKKNFEETQRKEILLLLIAASTLWIITFFRGITSLEGQVFIPGARYAYPVVIPTLYILITGWYYLLNIITKKYNLLFFSIISVWFLLLNTLSILSILNFYH